MNASSEWLSEWPLLERLIDAHATALGADLAPYRNHAYRVLNHCAALASPTRDQLDKIAIAAVFHDLGIWTHGTLDYLRPSMELALDYLAEIDRRDWSDELAAMVLEHHKLRRYRAHDEWLVEAFRRADWIDVTFGALRFGLPRAHVVATNERFPDLGFHQRLLQLSLARLRSHPTDPLPMFRF